MSQPIVLFTHLLTDIQREDIFGATVLQPMYYLDDDWEETFGFQPVSTVVLEYCREDEKETDEYIEDEVMNDLVIEYIEELLNVNYIVLCIQSDRYDEFVDWFEHQPVFQKIVPRYLNKLPNNPLTQLEHSFFALSPIGEQEYMELLHPIIPFWQFIDRAEMGVFPQLHGDNMQKIIDVGHIDKNGLGEIFHN